jgi:solute carrier family 25 citrate transporter 1
VFEFWDLGESQKGEIKVAPRERERGGDVMVAADADGKKSSPLVALLAGGIAGGVEAACTYPFEFAKTRVQLYGHGGVRNPFSVVAKVAREEGLRALYKGCSTMIVVCSLSCFCFGVGFFDFVSIRSVY